MIRPDLVFTGLPAADRSQLLHALADRVAARSPVRDAEELYQQLWEREQAGSTGVGGGVAIPHCKLQGLEKGVIAVGLVPEGVDFAAADGAPVRLLFMVVSPSESPAEHLQALAAISRWVKSGLHGDEILSLDEPQALYKLLQREGG
jgi:nitrogen PTS system EIIA component